MLKLESCLLPIVLSVIQKSSVNSINSTGCHDLLQKSWGGFKMSEKKF